MVIVRAATFFEIGISVFAVSGIFALSMASFVMAACITLKCSRIADNSPVYENSKDKSSRLTRILVDLTC